MSGRLAAAAVVAALAGCVSDQSTVVVGSKSFTESVILGEILAQSARDAGVSARHQSALGGTRLVYNALAAGEIDAYVEYSGTLVNEIFAGTVDEASIADRLRQDGIAIAGQIGFENNYALGMAAAAADARGISNISDLIEHPDLRLRLSNEFMERADGWPGLKSHYGLPQTDVLGVDHDIAYRALAGGTADLTELYTTDAEIDYYGLRVLVDDRGFFPRYEALLLYRADLEARQPLAASALERITGRIDAATMAAMNAAVKLDGTTEADAAAAYLSDTFGIASSSAGPSLPARLARRTSEHVVLVSLSLFAAILIAIPLGIVAARQPRIGQTLLGAVGIGQTIPALALLVILVPLVGIGAGPALIALFIYSLLPILRNTHAGLAEIAPSLREAAEALGLPPSARLLRIELPLATPTILAGIKTAAVINVGGATLGALVGAGGYGQPILTGIRLDDAGLILEGAIPAALLALAVQWLLDRLERRMVRRSQGHG